MKRTNSIHPSIRNSIQCTLFTAIAGCLVSCANIQTNTAQYVGVKRYPPTNPAAVKIVRNEPAQKHERLGEIVLMASTYPAPTVAKVEEKLRHEAAEMGADAALVLYDRIQPVGTYSSGSWWSWNEQTMEGRKLVGIAIKYQ